MTGSGIRRRTWNHQASKIKIMESSDGQNKRNSNLRMWILLGIFLILAGLFVYGHFHQTNRRMESKLTNEDQVDY